MQYHPPSIPSIERSALVQDNTPVLICPSCGDTMRPVRTIPQLGPRLEQLIFVCPSCDEMSTKDVKRQIWRDILKIRREQIRNRVTAKHALLRPTDGIATNAGAELHVKIAAAAFANN